MTNVLSIKFVTHAISRICQICIFFNLSNVKETVKFTKKSEMIFLINVALQTWKKYITLNNKILWEILKFFTWKKDTIFFKINKKYEIFLRNIKICIPNHQNFDEFYFNVKSASDFASVKCDICKLFDLKNISSIKLSQMS